MPYLTEFITIALIHLLAVISPGPDFALIARNSLVYSRRVGVFSALGLAGGILVHITYSLVGIGLIISHSIVLFSLLKWLGAAYLVYLGCRSLNAHPLAMKNSIETRNRRLPPAAAIRMGFFTNVLNPKVTLFFFSLFTQVINPTTPVAVQMLYGLEMAVMTLVWFSLVAIVLSHQTIRQRFTRVQLSVEKVMGVILIGLGLRLAIAESK